ncbi:tetratricopeptide repeat protein [Actinoplanes solisilvae]|uniref:tetratricopeptide repeat protein n=1 Tax=Actinoplanes solisilvae TaxID=2486853 RepID=UPI000FD70EE9|nr:tetratricopeptide repeat protein [Actinoplanes solisilvae]
MSFQDDVRSTFRRGDSDAVLRMASAELARARGAGDAAGEVEALYAMSRVAIRGGDLTRGSELAGEALDVAIGSGSRLLEERPRHVLAAVARLAGDYPLARDRYLASIELNAELGHDETVITEKHNLAMTALRLGDVDQARELSATVREWVLGKNDKTLLPYVGVAAAAIATAENDAPRAAAMAGFSDAAFAALGQVPDPDDAAELNAIRASAGAALGAERFAGAYEDGKAWTPDEAF